MDYHEQQAALERDLREVIARYRAEFDLSLADAIGTIEVVKLQLALQQFKELEDEE